MTHPLDEKQPKLDALIASHPFFAELKLTVDGLKVARFKKSKKLVGTNWNGYNSNAQYLSETTKNTVEGNKIADMQRQVLAGIDLLDDKSFELFRNYSIDWDKVRAW